MRVHGESMEPTLPDGCSILVARHRQRRRAGRIFAIITANGLVVKRLNKSRSGNWQLISDNSGPDWPPVRWTDEMELAGEVMWMARSL